MHKYLLFLKRNILVLILFSSVISSSAANFYGDTLTVELDKFLLQNMDSYVRKNKTTGVVNFVSKRKYSYIQCSKGDMVFGKLFHSKDQVNSFFLQQDSIYRFTHCNSANDTLETWFINRFTFLKELEYKSFHVNGAIESSVFYKNGNIVGKAEYWTKDGIKWFSGTFCDGLMDFSDCNCLKTKGCLGDIYQIEFANEWYENGKKKYELTKIDTNRYIYTHYSVTGNLINTDVLEKDVIGNCFLIDLGKESDIYFLKIVKH